MKKLRNRNKFRPLKARYHEAGNHLHDTRHEAGNHLHDTRHEAGNHLHDTRHEAGNHLHDTRHEAGNHLHDTRHEAGNHLHDTRYNAGPDLHDTQHFLQGNEHGNSHLVSGDVSVENDEVNPSDMPNISKPHSNYSIVLYNESGRVEDKNSSYFYGGYEQYTQRGYLKVNSFKDETGKEISNQEFYVLFHNDKRHRTYRGEETRRVYFQVRKASLVLRSQVLKIPIACNFDVVQHQPVFPGTHHFQKTDGGGLELNEQSFKVNPDSIHPVNVGDQHLIDSSNLAKADVSEVNDLIVGIKNFESSAKGSNEHWGYLKLNNTVTEPKEDLMLYVSEQPVGQLNNPNEFEIRTIPILLAGNVIELDVAYFKQGLGLF